MTTTLTSIEVASMLKKHVVTVREMAVAGRIPAAKVGGDWLFLEDDLVAYIRAQYKQAPVPSSCLSTSSPVRPTGTRTSPSLVKLDYVDRLAQRIAKTRSASTTNGKRSYGS